VIAVRWAALALFAAAVAVTYGLYSHIPAGFLPVEDQGYFFAVMQLPDGAALQRTEQVAETVRKILVDKIIRIIPSALRDFRGLCTSPRVLNVRFVPLDHMSA
jgi:multidrug efflux pump subunit AcrB